MSRAATIRRRRREDEAWLSVCRRAEDDAEDLRDECERLREELARVRDELAEVEGWYRLLQENHASLQESERRASRRTTELQSESNRLEAENHELRAVASADVAGGRETRNRAEGATMTMRYQRVLQRARDHKWAFAALMAIATLLARDPGVRGVLGQVAGRVRQAVEGDDVASRDAATGYVRYAAMLNSRDQAERAKAEYNANEATLKGDALLEAQDRLRAAKARYREARLAFLPELAHQCEQAKVALPSEAAQALASLKAETNE